VRQHLPAEAFTADQGPSFDGGACAEEAGIFIPNHVYFALYIMQS